jgi:hypothetical protein
MKWATIALLLISGSALAQTPKYSAKEITAWNKVQYDMTQCAAVWYRLKACAPGSAESEEIKQAEQTADHFLELAIGVGTEIGMTHDAINSRLKIATEDQTKLIEGKCINFSSLAARYLTRCKALGEHPEATFQEYMNR